MIHVSNATEEERDWAASLLAGSEPWTTLGVTLDQCRKNCHDPEYQVFVVRLDERLCGAVILDPRGVAGSPYIKSIAVAPDLRGRSIGAALMHFAEDLFREQARHLFLCVSSFNTRARSFYERLGYRSVAEFPDYIIQGASEILMHRRLR